MRSCVLRSSAVSAILVLLLTACGGDAPTRPVTDQVDRARDIAEQLVDRDTDIADQLTDLDD